MQLKDKILHYLASGVQANRIASLVGCSPGYISQLVQDEEFRAVLEKKISEDPVPVEEALEAKYESLEHRLVDQISNEAGNAEFRDAVRALEIVAKTRDMKAQRKNPALNSINAQNVQVVQLMLPTYMTKTLPTFEMNSESEILSLNNASLAPLSAGGVKNLFNSLREQQAAAKEQIMEL